MRILIRTFAALVLLGMAAPAFADFTNFNLAGMLTDGGTLTGSIAVNNGYFDPEGIVVQDAGFSYPFQGNFYEGVDMQGGMPYGLYSVSYQGGPSCCWSFRTPRWSASMVVRCVRRRWCALPSSRAAFPLSVDRRFPL